MTNRQITNRYYPQLSDIVDENKVPKIIKEFLLGEATTNPVKVGVLGKIHYRILYRWLVAPHFGSSPQARPEVYKSILFWGI